MEATAPDVCSPATVRGTGCSPPCGAPGWPASRAASRPTTGSCCTGLTFSPPCAARRRPTSPRRRSARPVRPSCDASSSCSRGSVCMWRWALSPTRRSPPSWDCATDHASDTGWKQSWTVVGPSCARFIPASRTLSPASSPSPCSTAWWLGPRLWPTCEVSLVGSEGSGAHQLVQRFRQHGRVRQHGAVPGREHHGLGSQSLAGGILGPLAAHDAVLGAHDRLHTRIGPLRDGQWLLPQRELAAQPFGRPPCRVLGAVVVERLHGALLGETERPVVEEFGVAVAEVDVARRVQHLQVVGGVDGGNDGVDVVLDAG